MTGRHYADDTTPDDLRSGDQCRLECPCGHNTIPAWARLPKDQRFTPMRDLRAKMICRRCGRRRPAVVIRGMSGMTSQLHELKRWSGA